MSDEQDDIKVEVVPIESLQPDPNNANMGTERGYYMLTDSIQERGAGRGILASQEGVILAGNKTHQAAIDTGIQEVLLVHTTGDQLVVTVRDDLEADSPEARRMALEDNRIGMVSLDFDPAVLLEMGKEDDTIFEGLFRDDELEEILAGLMEGKDEPPPPTSLVGASTALVESDMDRWSWVKHVVIPFSGGRDSSAALLWAATNFPNVEKTAVYVDMGAEYPGFLWHVMKVARFCDIPLRTLRTENTILELMLSKGWPSWCGPWCQGIMFGEMKEWLDCNCEIEDTLVVTGRRSRQTKKSEGFDAGKSLYYYPDYRAYTPVAVWGDSDLERILGEHDVPLWDGYGCGLSRTACWCCPGQRPTTYAVMREHFPMLFESFCDMEAVLGSELWQPQYQTFSSVQASADHGVAQLAKRRLS